MSKWLYPETVAAVEHACAQFLSGKASGADLQATLYMAEHEIVAYEEQWFRSLLSEAENRIEEITFTESSEQQFTSTVSVVNWLLANMERGH